MQSGTNSLVKTTILGLILSLGMVVITKPTYAIGENCGPQFVQPAFPEVTEDVEWGRAAQVRQFDIRKEIPGTGEFLRGDATYYPVSEVVTFFIIARLNIDGQVYSDPEFTGAQIMTALVNHITSQRLPIRSLIGTWSNADEAMVDNLNTFNRMSLQGTLEDAAWATFTGKMARRLGFSRIGRMNTYGGQPGQYTRVEIHFSRP